MHPWTGQMHAATRRGEICSPGGMRLSSGKLLIAAALLDVFHNTLALMMAVSVLGGRIRAVRILFAAFSGAAAAFAASIVHLSRMSCMLLWMPVSMMMMRLAAGREKGFFRNFRRAAVLLACEGFLGGVVLALYGAISSLSAAHLLSAVLGAAVFVGVSREREMAPVQRVRIICRFSGRRISFDAMIDSGNTLRDYLTKRPVIVAGTDLLGMVRRTGIKPRLIAADTAGGRQLMQIVAPDETVIETGRGRFRVDATLAFSPALTDEVLAPASLLIQKRLSINGGGLSIWRGRWRNSGAVSSRET